MGPIDDAAVVETFLGSVSRGSEAAAVMADAWRAPGLLTVERRTPIVTGSGKILHLHVQR